ncbi:ThiF family adenylyltransferase [Pseudomonas qingdaonensis]|uniref:ThiF family adenylyltransferase n=1 Tax=Pseudomonas qingdaonensis TaxID=2056231 RepID=UPI002E193343
MLDRSEILSRDLSGTAQNLEGSRVVCVGVGSLGSTVALQLARSGVGHLTLIDPDHLVSANLGRHVLGADDLGLPKAEALQVKIRKDLPTTEVTAFPTFAEVVMYTNPEVFEKADLVVVTTADWQSEVALWGPKSNGTSWALLQAWSEPHTQVGHVLLAPSGAFDARGLFTDSGDFKHKLTEWPEGGVIALPACGESFIPGGSLGMVNVASMVSQAALRVLSGNIESPSWFSSINRPQDVTTLGGKYLGPELPAGMQQAQFERDWPELLEHAQ